MDSNNGNQGRARGSLWLSQGELGSRGAGEPGSWEPAIGVGRQEPPAGKERHRVTATLSPLSSGLRSAPILFGFECLRIVLEGNTDSFVIFGGVEQTGLSSFRPAAHL